MTSPRASWLPVALAALALAACDGSPALDPGTRFACQGDQDCAEGFVCAPTLGECVPVGTELDAGLVDAGVVDAGEVDAGAADAGEADGGEVDAGEVDAGESDAGLDDGGAGDDAGTRDGGGADAGPPQAIVISSAQQALYVGACSAPFTVQLRDALGQPTAAPAPTPITVSTSAGVTLHAAADCSGAEQAVYDVPAGSSAVSLYFRGLDAGTYTLRAASPGLGQDTQDTFIRLPPDTLAITSTPPAPLPAGTCFALSVQARRGASSTPVAGSTPISVTVAPAGAARFHTSSSCTGTAVSTFSISSGSNAATVYVKTLSGGAITLTANASFGSATQMATVIPAVRTGTCTFPSSMNGQAQTITCPISPALGSLGRSFLVFQGTTGALATTAQNIRCRLLSAASVECGRRTGSGAATVAWQAAESPTGLRVEHVPPTACGTVPSTLSLAASYNPSRSFVLKSASNAGNNFDNDDMPVAVLSADGGTVALSPGDCETLALQVVELTGSTVARGEVDGGLAVGATQVEAPVTATALATSAVLAQPHSSIDGAAPACAILARAELSSTTRVRFSRGLGATVDAGCDDTSLSRLFFERVDFGARAAVQQHTATLGPSELTTTLPITPVDRTRALVFSSSQVLAGQGTAETDLIAAGMSLPTGDALVRFGFDDDATVRVTRESATSSARVTFYVVELVP